MAFQNVAPGLFVFGNKMEVIPGRACLYIGGATESSRTVLRAVKVIVALFLEFIKEK